MNNINFIYKLFIMANAESYQSIGSQQFPFWTKTLARDC